MEMYPLYESELAKAQEALALLEKAYDLLRLIAQDYPADEVFTARAMLTSAIEKVKP